MGQVNGLVTLTNPKLNENVALTATATNLNLVDDNDFFIRAFERQNLILFNHRAFSTAFVESGSYDYEGTIGHLDTGATASSSAAAYDTLRFGIIGGDPKRIPFSKKIVLIFGGYSTEAVANTITRVHLKANNAAGALAHLGFGIKQANLVLTGESYGAGASIASVALGNVSDYTPYRIKIVHDPSVPSISWYVDTGTGFPTTPTATQTTSASIPQTDAAADSSLMFQITNGATAAAAQYKFSTPIMWVSEV